MIHTAPPVALSVPPPPIPPPPPPTLPQTPSVIQHQGAYATTIPTYPASPQQTASSTNASVSYTQQSYSSTGHHKYSGYTRNRCVGYKILLDVCQIT